MGASVRGLRRLAAKQDGIVSRDDARALGLTERQFEWACRSSGWERIHLGTYCTTGLKPTWRQLLRAAVVATAPEGVVAGVSAAALMRWDGFPQTLIVVAVPRNRNHALAQCTLHKTRAAIPAEHRWRVEGFVCTTPVRTLADLGLTCSDDELVTAINYLARKFDIDKLRALRSELRAMPGRDVGRVVRHLEGRIYCADGPEVGLETMLLRILRTAGFRPTVQFRLRDDGRIIKRFDFAFPQHLVGVEVDSRFHNDPLQKALDDAQRGYARALGWDVIVAKASDVRHPDSLIERIRTAIERAVPPPGNNTWMPGRQLDLLERPAPRLDRAETGQPPPTGEINEAFFARGARRIQRVETAPKELLFEPNGIDDPFVGPNPFCEEGENH